MSYAEAGRASSRVVPGTLFSVRIAIALALVVVAVVCGLLATYGFDQVVNPPRCGSEEVFFSCHGDLWYHLVTGVFFVIAGLSACVVGTLVAFRLRVVRDRGK